MTRIAAFIVLMFALAAQGQSNYEQALKMGDEAFQRGQYKTAVNKYFAAEAFDPSKKDVIKGKVDQVFDKIEKLRGAAERAQKSAEDAQKVVANTSDAFRLMLLAKQEASNDPTIALRIAEAALKKHQDPLITDAASEIFLQNEFYTKKSLAEMVNKPFRCAAVSRDGTKIATGNDDNMVRLWTIEGELIREFSGHRYPIMAVCFSPDGTQILSGGYDKTAILWNVTDTVKKIFKGHTEPLLAVAFSPDGKKVLTAAYNYSVRLWDVAGSSTDFLHEYLIPGAINALAFTADGSHILVGTGRQTLLYKTDGSEKNEIPVAATAGFFFKDGETIISGEKNDTIGLFTTTGDLITQFETAPGKISSLAFSSGGDNILVGSENGGVMILDNEGSLKKEYGSNAGAILGLAFSKNGKVFYAWSKDNAVRCWQTEKALDITYSLQKGKESFSSLDFSPDGKKILTLDTESVPALWSIDGSLLHRFSENAGEIKSVDFSAGGNGIIVYSNDSSAVLWSQDGQKLAQFSGCCVSFSADGKNMLTIAGDGRVRLLSNTGQLLKELKPVDSGKITMTAISPYDGRMITGTDQSVISLWNNDGTLVQRIKLNDTMPRMFARRGAGTVKSVIFSPDKINMFVTLSIPHSRGFAQKYLLVNTKNYVAKGINKLPQAFSADGSKLIYLDDPGVRVTDINGKLLKEYALEDPDAATFSADGEKIITATTDGIIKVWTKNMTLEEFLKSDKLDKLTAAQKKEFGITD